MSYEVIISPKPFRIVVDTFSSPDAAEELARQRFREMVRELDNIHDADHSTVVVNQIHTCRCDSNFNNMRMNGKFCDNPAAYMAKSHGNPDQTFPACAKHVEKWYREDGSGYIVWVEKL